MRTEILYEDNSILVIRKPAGLAVQSARIGQADVVSELKSYLAKQAGAGQGEPYLAVIHRLDQPVEGVLVFAKEKKRQQMLAGLIRPTKKPDLDNVIKSILDALNKVAYHDDTQIVSLSMEKFYSDSPRVEVTISNLENKS